MRFDLLILGDTPDAWTAAAAAARLGRRTAVLRPDAGTLPGSNGVNAVVAAYGDSSFQIRKGSAGPRELWHEAVARHERSVASLGRSAGVRSWRGPVRLAGPTTANFLVEGEQVSFDARHLLIATGSVARRPSAIAADHCRVLLPEDAARLGEAPASLLVLGGNRTARAFARFFAVAGSTVTVLDAPYGLGLQAAVAGGLRVVTGDVASLHRDEAGVIARLTDRRELVAEAILFAADRPGATADLDLRAAGLETDENGRLWCDEQGQTWAPNVSAAGEVVGFPRWLRENAATATEIVKALLETSGTGSRERAAILSGNG